ncbi:MAG: TIGR03790 family protein [Chthoniobacter sp.]|nr:TIGR03790 family protein [Chthoniobacter sp.]
MCCALAGAVLLFGGGKGWAQESKEDAADAAATLVIYNQNDKDSTELARFYAEKRGIAKDHVLAFKCAKTEEITRDEYDRTIAEPLRRAMTANFWWKLREPNHPQGPVEANKIRFIALMRGMPLKIAERPKYPGDAPNGAPPVGTVNAAAVDSELSVVGLNLRQISGALVNPYFRGFASAEDFRHPEIMLVCRLDGPTPEIVRRMITDSLAAEKEGLAGLAYVDARNIAQEGYTEGDKWLYDLAKEAGRRGTPVVMDNGPELFPEPYPMTQAALYFGWYTEHAAGPFIRPGFRFTRGAVAVHIHSFSGSTVRDPIRNWVAPLLAAGAAATIGNVYEPYLALTPQLDIFHSRLRAGFTFAESAYMSMRALSWMTTFVGDPLYRPYKGVLTLEEMPAKGEWAEYRKGAQLWLSADRAAGDAWLRDAGKRLRSGVIMEGLGLLQASVNDDTAALVSFAQAREYYGATDDAMRVAFHEVFILRKTKRFLEAMAIAHGTAHAVPKSPAAELLKSLATPPEPPATPAPAAAPVGPKR